MTTQSLNASDSNDPPSIDLLREGGVAWITFNNPAKRNATTLAMLRSLSSIVHDANADPDVRAIVFRGAGGKAFVSGSDVSEFHLVRKTPAQIADYKAIYSEAVSSIRTCTKPTVAMIEGWCIGGGLVIAVSCDFRLSSDSAMYAAPGAGLGIAYSFDDLFRLTSLVGPSLAKDIVFTARRFSATEAKAMGMVDQIIPADQLVLKTTEYTNTIAQNAPLSIYAAKLSIEMSYRNVSSEHLARCQLAIEACEISDDYIEGQKAFAERRKPHFLGR